MPAEDDDDLYDGDYEFVDEDEYEDDEEYEYEDETDVEEDEEEPAAEEVVEAAPEPKSKKKTTKSKPAASKKKTPPKKKEPAKPKKKAPAKKQKQKEIFDEEPADEEAVDETATGSRDVPEDADSAPEIEAEVGSEADEYGRSAPAANYVVHVYEHKKYLRTIDRPFTPEEADAFAREYNRCSKTYGRWAAAGKADVKPGKELAP